MSSLHYHGPPRDICLGVVSQHLGWLASQDKGPVLTLLALLALRAVLHSSGPRLTRHGTCVNHACPSRLPFTLDVELGRETVLHCDLDPSSTHVETLLVARTSGKSFKTHFLEELVHQS